MACCRGTCVFVRVNMSRYKVFNNKYPILLILKFSVLSPFIRHMMRTQSNTGSCFMRYADISYKNIWKVPFQ